MSALSTGNTSSLSTNIFCAIAICVLGYYGMKALDFDKIGVQFVRLDTPAVAPDTSVQKKILLSSVDGGAPEQLPTIANVLSTMRPKTDVMDVLEKEKNTPRALYIAKYYKTAVEEMRKFGIPASITLAQGLLESNAGQSKLAKYNNNHFGIKCFSQRCKAGHCTNSADDSHKDFFLKYNSAWASYRAHSKLLTGAYYRACFTCGKDYRCWAKKLKERGYATSKTYDTDLIRIIELYELDKLDRLQ